MGNDYNGYSLSDIAAATGRNNGAFGNDGWWIILLLLAFNGFGGYGFGGMGGFGGAMGADFMMYPWLSNGQKEIMQNTNQGFDTLQLANQLNNINTGVQGISTQLCNGFSGVNQSISNGFYNAEIAANSRQMADMNQNFNNQIATLQGFNGLQKSLDQCCCDNRLATCQTQNIVQNEGNATRFSDANNTRDIITNATQNTQAILDKLCQLELDGVKAQVEAKNDKINDLQRELSMKDLAASQIAQNAFISQGFSNEVDALYNRLNSCPVPTTPVYRKNADFYVQ